MRPNGGSWQGLLSRRDPARRLASSSCFSWMKRLHIHTQLVILQKVN